MEKERLAYLFQKYIDQTYSPEELEEFMAMLRNADKLNHIETVLDNFWDKSPDVEMEKGKADEILKRVIASDFNKKQKKPSITIKMWLSRIAAIMVIGVAGLLINNMLKKDDQVVKKEHNKTNFASKEVKTINIKTLNEHQKVALPDGSTVVLNTNSSISYSSDFGNKTRDVVLTGEGYFDIKHDDQKSFTVYTGKIKTTVLGTAFNIKAYYKEKNIEVTVTRGKVSVTNDNSILAILIPNQQVIYNKDYAKSKLTTVEAKDIVQWQESDLFFDDVSMEQAAAILSQRFNTAINFKNDQVKKCRFTATFLKRESLDEILKIICSYNNAQYQSNAGAITIKGNGCD